MKRFYASRAVCYFRRNEARSPKTNILSNFFDNAGSEVQQAGRAVVKRFCVVVRCFESIGCTVDKPFTTQQGRLLSFYVFSVLCVHRVSRTAAAAVVHIIHIHCSMYNNVSGSYDKHM
jgi:hypothetical protein